MTRPTTAATPQAVAQQDHLLGPLLAVLGAEAAAELGLGAQQVEQVRRHGVTHELLRLALADQVHRLAADGGHAVEGAPLLQEVGELGGRDGSVLEPRLLVAVPDHHDALGVAVRQRLQEHRFDDAEDGRVGADAHRQRDQRDGGEQGIVAQQAQGEPRVLPQLMAQLGPAHLHLHLVSDGTAFRAHARGVSEAPQRRLARGFGRHALGEVTTGLHLEVEGDLLVHLLLHGDFPEQRAQTPPRLAARHGILRRAASRPLPRPRNGPTAMLQAATAGVRPA
jgi:hypothetical protein